MKAIKINFLETQPISKMDQYVREPLKNPMTPIVASFSVTLSLVIAVASLWGTLAYSDEIQFIENIQKSQLESYLGAENFEGFEVDKGWASSALQVSLSIPEQTWDNFAIYKCSRVERKCKTTPIASVIGSDSEGRKLQGFVYNEGSSDFVSNISDMKIVMADAGNIKVNLPLFGSKLGADEELVILRFRN